MVYHLIKSIDKEPAGTVLKTPLANTGPCPVRDKDPAPILGAKLIPRLGEIPLRVRFTLSG
jgi:hypothetical protein